MSQSVTASADDETERSYILVGSVHTWPLLDSIYTDKGGEGESTARLAHSPAPRHRGQGGKVSGGR